MSAALRIGKSVGGFLLFAMIPYALLSAAYHWGYGNGYSAGAKTMRNAIMCVLERTANIPPYEYCARQEGQQ